MQIILCFESRLHIHHIVHGFCSIVHWLLFTLFSRISFHRKKSSLSTVPTLMDVFRPQWHGGDGGEVNNCTYRFSGCHTVRLWGQRKKKNLKHTHAYRLHIDHLVSRMCEFFIGKSWHGSSNKPEAQKADIHIQLMCERLTYSSSRILPRVSLLLWGSFKTLCQLHASTRNWVSGKKHKESVLKPSSPPKTTS